MAKTKLRKRLTKRKTKTKRRRVGGGSAQGNHNWYVFEPQVKKKTLIERMSNSFKSFKKRISQENYSQNAAVQRE